MKQCRNSNRVAQIVWNGIGTWIVPNVRLERLTESQSRDKLSIGWWTFLAPQLLSHDPCSIDLKNWWPIWFTATERQCSLPTLAIHFHATRWKIKEKVYMTPLYTIDFIIWQFLKGFFVLGQWQHIGFALSEFGYINCLCAFQIASPLKTTIANS